ncbi:hypothetical protein GCM10022243_44370 [Saccharothrix violaceirubra]|uniref:DUF742 domain-containing protein n=1 Tax=Saccharothrix violaceirubra TaxID=413306 RepID=A0A7W7T176_9PSEU|nr:DUF742 domain-containing protein [Saccharothrix violaceirubra]MBB4964673.1 hypothetical protein [Saccharothrix violaceirubra]
MSPDPESSTEQTFADLLNGFSLDSPRRHPPAGSRPDAVETRPQQPVYPDEDDDGDYQPEDAPAIVRAYSWTGGRTTTSYHLEIETLVSVVEWDLPPGTLMKAEHQEVVNLVARPRSVAEVAALLRVPLGVAKVLLGDMAERGLIDIHLTATSDGETPDLGLMERVLAGLRRL